MGLFHWLFGKKKQEAEETEDWDTVEYSREGIDFHSQEERTRYVGGLAEQLRDADRDLSALEGEYARVTAYLTDLEEVEALPEAEKKGLRLTAHKLINTDKEKQGYLSKKRRLSDKTFYHLQEMEDELEEGIRKIKEAEEYSSLVKLDLHRLEGERHAYYYRRSELQGMLGNYRGMAVIFLTALVVCVCFLLVLQFYFKMDTTAGYFVSVVSAAAAITILCFKYMDGEKELRRVERSINRLVQVQNRVKIRYVNNTNLLDYLYMKYEVESGKQLAAMYKSYLQEKEERKQFQELEAKRSHYVEMLQLNLRRYRVRYPDRLTARPGVLVEKNEMVEMRHELIIRRQALRKQLDYNSRLVERAKNEIAEVIRLFPQYAEELKGLAEGITRGGADGS